jgi:hypothetical protein
MNINILTLIIVGAIAGGLGVLLVIVIGKAFNLRIFEGKRMGLNLARGLTCPKCSAPLPTVRKPQNLNQALWGGWTCKNCGSEFDKWLKPM